MAGKKRRNPAEAGTSDFRPTVESDDSDEASNADEEDYSLARRLIAEGYLLGPQSPPGNAEDYPPRSPASHVSSFTGSDKEREQRFLADYYARRDAAAAERARKQKELVPGQKRKIDEFDQSEMDTDDAAYGRKSLPRSLESYGLREAVESAAIVVNFMVEVNGDVDINIDDPYSIRNAIRYTDERWDDKSINWDGPIERAHERGPETAERLYEMPVVGFMDMVSAVLMFTNYLFGQGVEIL
ncbi:hypothetical protein F5Y13DRAFT_185925 [Hypoxylon sp. FL1857]|nr:hypothetical protein F5Y13DRAFT_185925 [Hypoxylon sp. FL1857]